MVWLAGGGVLVVKSCWEDSNVVARSSLPHAFRPIGIARLGSACPSIASHPTAHRARTALCVCGMESELFWTSCGDLLGVFAVCTCSWGCAAVDRPVLSVLYCTVLGRLLSTLGGEAGKRGYETNKGGMQKDGQEGKVSDRHRHLYR